jgi:putative SOS response-associated peptidase YedK
MCGRFTNRLSEHTIRAHFQVARLPPEFHPRYNIAPGQEALAILGPWGAHEARLLRWGLIPAWARDPAIGFNTINARAETAHRLPAFRAAFRQRRCLIPADGFYEWRRDAEGKTPFWIHLAGEQPFAFAGLWEEWAPPDGGPPLRTFTILTTEAAEPVRPLHPRMPVILPPEHYARWLDPAVQDPALLQPLLRPAPALVQALQARRVSRLVNSPRNDSPACLAPLAPDPGPG